ncbi:hypothetical protein [Mycolicibacterium aichiense]|uniref:Transmembrane protein n=1 Tax=Mycolicibacterium aichiense TaxID=1799 RepID=A0AAD1HJU9_9MYCO|nr:hypothetical protein [Mycolicibacterium aichiense]MCV7020887.1 hypothetical protein [Mycolicibacterium aichiense]BBX05453.1 hypothetical protein MAIC_02560 [Mycolicibacterium aichiense]STZ25194.1 Uncharacterised protein [Mycolicibacterium aichiense]
MWFDLYLVSAVVAAVGAWLISPRFQSYDPPGDVVRGICSAVAGALWPVIVVGAAQILAVRYIVRRLRSPRVDAVDVDAADFAPLVALPNATLGS